jgi:hypothetical protein
MDAPIGPDPSSTVKALSFRGSGKEGHMRKVLRSIGCLAYLFTAPGRVYAIAAPVLMFEIGLANLIVR